MAKVAILGASGFVGSTLFEYLTRHTDHELLPFAHSSGGASCLAHLGLSLKQVDMLDRNALADALEGVDYVLNCARGNKEVMVTGMENLVRAARKAKVRKLVHLSSVAVYGDPPHPDSTNEDAPASPAPASYGAIKLTQDELIQRAAEDGLGAVILCPPNIIGPYSDYVLDILQSIERSRFKLIDDGRHPISVIDVINLCSAFVSALESNVADGRRLFICQPESTTWLDMYHALEPVLRQPFDLPSVAESEYLATLSPTPSAQPTVSGNALTHLVSDEVRTAIRLHPTWAAIEGAAKGAVRRIGGRTEDYMRDVAVGPMRVDQAVKARNEDTPLIAQQLRKVHHNPARAASDIDFVPPLSFDQSMARFRQWYTEYMAADTPAWSLLGEAFKP